MKPTLDRGKAAVTAESGASAAVCPARASPWNDRRMDHHHPALAVRHHHPGAGFRDPHRVHGRHAAHRRSPFSGQARLRTRRELQQVLLPYENPRDGDIIVFRYPVDISQTFVKRVVGIAGDHIKIIDQQVYRNGKKTRGALHRSQKIPIRIRSATTSPTASLISCCSTAPRDMLANNVVNGEVVVPPDSFFAMGDNRDNSLDKPLLGLRPRAETSLASRSLSTGPTMPAPRAWLARRSTISRATSWIWPSIFSPRPAGIAHSG